MATVSTSSPASMGIWPQRSSSIEPGWRSRKVILLRPCGARQDVILADNNRSRGQADTLAASPTFSPGLTCKRQQVVIECQRRDGRPVSPLQIVGCPIRREGFPNKVTVVGNQRSRDLANAARFDLVGQVVE